MNFNVDHDKSSSNVRSARLKHEHICVTSSLQTLDAFIYIETEKNPGKEERKKEKKKSEQKPATRLTCGYQEIRSINSRQLQEIKAFAFTEPSPLEYDINRKRSI